GGCERMVPGAAGAGVGTVGAGAWTRRSTAAAVAALGCFTGQGDARLPKRPPIATEATATSAAAQMTRACGKEPDEAGLIVFRGSRTCFSACKNSVADGKRCAGSFARARRMALFSECGRLGSTPSGGAGGLLT